MDAGLDVVGAAASTTEGSLMDIVAVKVQSPAKWRINGLGIYAYVTKHCELFQVELHISRPPFADLLLFRNGVSLIYFTSPCITKVFDCCHGTGQFAPVLGSYNRNIECFP
jgi:hypothetical protein